MHGVYLIPQVPVTHYGRFMLAVLWTGVPEAVLSHDTALDLYQVCDINPTMVHMTVNKIRRIKRRGGEGYLVHHENLEIGQISWWEGLPIATLATAIRQSITDGTPTYLLEQALENGRKKGLLIKEEAAQLDLLLKERNEKR